MYSFQSLHLHIWELIQQKFIKCDKVNPALLKVRERELFYSTGEYLSVFFRMSDCYFISNIHTK